MSRIYCVFTCNFSYWTWLVIVNILYLIKYRVTSLRCDIQGVFDSAEDVHGESSFELHSKKAPGSDGTIEEHVREEMFQDISLNIWRNYSYINASTWIYDTNGLTQGIIVPLVKDKLTRHHELFYLLRNNAVICCMQGIGIVVLAKSWNNLKSLDLQFGFTHLGIACCWFVFWFIRSLIISQQEGSQFMAVFLMRRQQLAEELLVMTSCSRSKGRRI